MPSHDDNAPKNDGGVPEHIPGGQEPEAVDAAAGYEVSDVRVSGIVVFLVALGIFVGVVFVLCYGIGKVLNAHLNKEDGPTTKWTQTVDIRQLGNMPSSPEMQNKVTINAIRALVFLSMVTGRTLTRGLKRLLENQ